MPDDSAIGDALASFRSAAGEVEKRVGYFNQVELTQAIVRYVLSGGELTVTSIEKLAEAAAAYLEAEKVASTRADRDREASTAATLAMVHWTRAYVIMTGVLVIAAFFGLYIQTHSGH